MELKNFYFEVKLKKDFNIVRETLSRIGILKKNSKKLYQTCHLFHNNGKYYIAHFKELFSMFSFINEDKVDEEKIHMDDSDFYRRNSIIFLLKNWDLIDFENIEYINEHKGNIKIDIVSHKEKHEYELITKFKLGKKKENE